MSAPGAVASFCPFERGCATDDEHFAALTAAVFSARFRPAVVRARWPAIARAFADFSLATVAVWPDEAVASLLEAPGIIRSPKKVLATVRNARELATLVEQHGSVRAYIDSFRPDVDALVADIDRWAHYVGAPSIRAFVACAGVEPRWRLHAP